MAITLTTSGAREVVDEDKATTMIDEWRDQLHTHRQAHPSESVLCDKIVLTSKSYTSAAANKIKTFLTSSDEFQPSIASGVSVADLSDIIASRMEEEGLDVLNTMSETFIESKNLVEVDLSDNAMGSKGVSACETVLSNSSLERLSLCNNGLSEYTMNEVAELLTKQDEDGCIAQNLTKIHFFNNMSGPKGCEAFAKIMEKCTNNKLTDIRFSSTRAGPEGSVHIATALNSLAEGGNLENLIKLDLLDNSFQKEESYKNLANALKQCPKLKHLNLRDCMLKDEGIKQVCNALASAKLVSLDISGNEITAKGARSVAKLIRNVNPTIEDFKSEENEMTSYGVRSIMNAIDAPLLKTLVLNENECGNIGGQAILQSVQQDRIPKLGKIELNINMFQGDVMESLIETFGEKLAEMEDNDDDEDVDEDLEEEESSDDEGEQDNDIDALTGSLQKVSI